MSRKKRINRNCPGGGLLFDLLNKDFNYFTNMFKSLKERTSKALKESKSVMFP